MNYDQYYKFYEEDYTLQFKNFVNYWQYFTPNWVVINLDSFWNGTNEVITNGHIFYRGTQDNDSGIWVDNDDNWIIKNKIVYLYNLPLHCGLRLQAGYDYIYCSSPAGLDISGKIQNGDIVYLNKYKSDITSLQINDYIISKMPGTNGYLYSTEWENNIPYLKLIYSDNVFNTEGTKYNWNISLNTNKFYLFQEDVEKNVISQGYRLDGNPGIKTNTNNYLNSDDVYNYKFYIQNDDNKIEEYKIDTITNIQKITIPDMDDKSNILSFYQLFVYNYTKEWIENLKIRIY